MIFALAGQFKQLSHEPVTQRDSGDLTGFNGIRTHDLCDAGVVL